MKRIVLLLPVVLLATAFLVTTSPHPARAATYTVDTALDSAMMNACTGAAADCSLRGALSNTFASAGVADTITFDPAVFPPGAPATITISAVLQVSGNAATVIDGTGAGVIVDGAGEPSGFNCFELLGSSSTVRNIQVTDCTIGIKVNVNNATVGPGNVIFDNGTGVSLTAVDGVVKGNMIGTNAAGTAVNPAGGNTQGVAVAGTGNTVGGTAVADRNIISANTGTGIGVIGATNAVIKGNYIGTGASGTTDLGNGSMGIYIETSTGTIIGGSAAADRNIISGNNSDGIRNYSGASGTIVRGNYIGLGSDGSTVVANTGDGIDVNLGGGVTVGGSAAGEGNVISGNGSSGVVLTTTNAPSTVAGNLIGLDAVGTLDKSNGANGVYIIDSNGNTVGGTTAGHRNVISGHGAAAAAGIKIADVDDEVFVRGNYIGTDITGSASIPNTDGVNINNSFFVAVGGTAAGSRNVISGNIDDGIEIAGGSTDGTIRGNYIGIDATGAADLGNGANGIQIYGGATFNVIGGSTLSARNIISGNNGTAGILLTGVFNNTVSGNYIGLDAAGSTAIPNNNGIEMSGTGNVVGGQAAGEGNVISGNNDNGVEISGTNNSVLGNIIGLDATGANDRGNTLSGVLVTASNNIVGDNVTAGDGNVISGNDLYGIEVTDADTTGTTIEANIIGLDAAGTTDRGNTLDGVHIDASDGNTIGGVASSSRNIVSGNNSDGVELANDANANTVKMNYIGTDVTGTLDRGNSAIGVNVVSSDNNIIGAANEGNLSSGNNADGFEISTASVGNTVQGNTAGLKSDGVSALANGTNGIQILGSSSNNTVGGDLDSLANHFAFNGGDGITVSSGTGNLLARNSIHDNTALGIDLANDNLVTPNDVDDPDTGANNLQNFPVLTSASSVTTFTNVVGTLNSTPSTTFALRFYYSSSCDPSGNGEGQTYLAGSNQTTNVAGDVGFSINLGQPAPALSWITVTATDPSNNTSEFSNCVQVPALVVDTTSDSNLTACTTAANDCSLRGAINDANAASDADIIQFSIGSGAQTIAPGSTLPSVTQPVTIDGTTQPGFAGSPLIELNGTGAGALTIGLSVTGGNSTIRGLVINRFGGSGIYISSNSNLIAGNYIGTNVAGTSDLGNGGQGIALATGINNTIGGTAATDRNVISGNTLGGVSVGATETLIVGNYIGTNAAGNAALGNGSDGVALLAGNNTVGGTTAGARNVISSNASDGIEIANGVSGNVVQGNYIGTDATGSSDLGNGVIGVYLDGDANTIGGTAAGAGNVISGNGNVGISVTGDSNSIQGNLIGANASGNAAIGNGLDGVLLIGANNVVGGTSAAARNIISGNGTGISISNLTATGNAVKGNYIGTQANGSIALANNNRGIIVSSSASGTTIGGPTAAERNVISGNGGEGVYVGFSSNTTIRGNYIGTNSAGTAALGNASVGIQLAANNVTIGGTAAGEGNIISGNGSDGINFFEAVTGVTVQGNYIGTNATATAAIPNAAGGITLDSAPGNTINGGNVISGNSGNGIHVSGSSGGTIQNNYIGTNASGTLDLGNSSHGIFVNGNGNTIGVGNRIAFNGGDGVAVVDTSFAGTGNTVSQAFIYSNDGLGIDLGNNGVTPNDLGDVDGSPNHYQNFPVITLASEAPSSQTIVSGYLNSAPNTSYTLNFFRSTACDSTGNGEGEASIELAGVTTDSFGFAQFSWLLDAASTPGQFITATATDPSGNTSEFSACRVVTSDFDADGDADSADNCPAWPNPTQALPAWTVPANDPDCDGFSIATEAYVGTNPADQCGAGAWPPDFNDSQSVSVTDVLAIKPFFSQAVPPAPARYDIKPSASISVTDVLELKPYFSKSCS